MAAVTDAVDTEHIAAVREFNRRYTRLIGVLQEHLLESEHSLTEVRILYELNNFGPLEVVTLRQDLDLDPGYLSRILTRFEQSDLVHRRRPEHDGPRQQVALTEHGRDVL
ncbi:MarR family winged helix-turn-helix transcriptional regulator, partial [Nocardia gipuzkoensis]